MASKIYDRDLIGFLRLHSDVDKEFLALIDTHLKMKLYYYGDHFKINKRRFAKLSFLINCVVTIVHNTFINLIKKKNPNPDHRVLSAAGPWYDNWLVKNLNYSVDRCNYSPSRFKSSMPKFNLLLQQMRILYILQFCDFNFLISERFKRTVYDYKQNIKDEIISNGYSLLLVPGDLDLPDRLLIQVFKELGLVTVCLAHGGMPSIYDHLNESKTDFVSMYGSRQVYGYTSSGYNPKRFLTTGHPHYDCWPTEFRFGLDNILVCTKSADGIPSEIDYLQHNRSECLSYIYEIGKVLKELGVKKAKLRMHPSENPDWYAKFIDTKFFVIDQDKLSASLANSTLVIGPVSTLFIDAIKFWSFIYSV